MTGINTGLVSDPAAPFGGVKESGFGREGGRHGIEEFQSSKARTIEDIQDHKLTVCVEQKSRSLGLALYAALLTECSRFRLGKLRL